MGQEAGEESLPTFWLEDMLTIPPMDGDAIIAFNLAKNVHTPSDVMLSERPKGDVRLDSLKSLQNQSLQITFRSYCSGATARSPK
ncbi:MAG: hypothetical protein ACI8YP_003639 [Algoriphagus sp.]|jgi:hypothetical protein